MVKKKKSHRTRKSFSPLCPKCTSRKWKTVKKHVLYVCRVCGYDKHVKKGKGVKA